MPSFVQKELDYILKKYLRWDFEGLLDDLDEIFAIKEINEEERIKAKLIQSSLISTLYDFGEEKGSRELSFKLAQEAVNESKNFGDTYLVTASKMCLASEYFAKTIGKNMWN